jgi:hypothetical protein
MGGWPLRARETWKETVYAADGTLARFGAADGHRCERSEGCCRPLRGVELVRGGAARSGYFSSRRDLPLLRSSSLDSESG